MWIDSDAAVIHFDPARRATMWQLPCGRPRTLSTRSPGLWTMQSSRSSVLYKPITDSANVCRRHRHAAQKRQPIFRGT